jgi:phosphoheptose isomerase
MNSRRSRHIAPAGGAGRHRLSALSTRGRRIHRSEAEGGTRAEGGTPPELPAGGGKIATRVRAVMAGPQPGRAERLTRRHVEELVGTLRDPAGDPARAARWGEVLAGELAGGARLLVAGNGGSAAEAQHLTAELVGRFRDERRPLSALALHAETSSVTAIVNDYGADEVFARQVEAHGRPGDTLLLLSTSGSSPNVLAAARRADAFGLRVWALTGPAPNKLADLADDALCVNAPTTTTVQEIHLMAVHLLCEAIDATLTAAGWAGSPRDVSLSSPADSTLERGPQVARLRARPSRHRVRNGSSWEAAW